MSVSNQKVTFTSVRCMLVAQLAHTCMFDNSHGQLNGAYKLLMGVSRERVTLLLNGTVVKMSQLGPSLVRVVENYRQNSLSSVVLLR